MSALEHPSDLPPGTVVGGRFRVRSILGEGGTAHVFVADDLAAGGEVALKVVKRRLKADPGSAERLAREGQLLRSLQHPAIVRVETWGEEPTGMLFLAMELLKGESLRDRITRKSLQPEELTPIIRDTTAALNEAHSQGIVHRDLKPDNLFLISDSSEVCVKLLDFGVSKAVNTERLTRTGQILGTPRYMAPEQLAGESTLDHRVDIYSMGIVLYEALSGQTPFSGTTPSELIVAILRGHVIPLASVWANATPEIEAVIERAIAKEPTNRFVSMQDLYDAWVQVAPSSGQVARDLATYRTAAMGKLVNPLTDGEEPEGDERPSRSGTFSALAAVKKSEVSADTIVGEDLGEAMQAAAEPSDEASPSLPEAEPEPTPRGGADETPAIVPAGDFLPMIEAPPRGLSSGAVSDAGRSQLKVADHRPPFRYGPATDGPSFSRYRSPKNRGFWASLKRGHIVGMVISAMVGACAGGSWVVWTVSQSRAAPLQGSPAPTAPVPQQESGSPDIILREGLPPEAANSEEGAGGPVADERRPAPTPARRSGVQGRSAPSRRAGASPDTESVRGGGGGGDATSGAGSARETARAARLALRQGRLDECVRMATEAYGRGVATALLTRADCLRAQSATASALKDYQRFCRQHASHRSVRLARARARRLGGSCP